MFTKENLFNTKIDTKGRSAEVQLKLFKLGIKWSSGDTEIREYPYLYIDKYGSLTYSNNDSYFKSQHMAEILVEDLLDCGKSEFSPFERVLVRNGNGEVWRPAFYSRKMTEGHLTIGSGKYTQCIKFEGNEEKVFER